jgi:diguanylate cyclase (GGDEF)-like protein
MADLKTYDQLLKDVQSLQKRIKDLESDLLEPGQVLMDPLTGVLSHDSLLVLGAKEVARGRRYGHPVSLILFDLDDFAGVNARYGAEIGDRVLRRVADVVGQQIRQTDLLFRSEGDAFVVILPETDIRMTEVLAERLVETIASIQIPLQNDILHITACAGAATFLLVEIALDALLAHAEMALKAAKAQGNGSFSAFQE